MKLWKTTETCLKKSMAEESNWEEALTPQDKKIKDFSNQIE